MNWQPLSKDWDYQKTWQRVEEEIFADDIQLIKRSKKDIKNK
jgi:hypothetical protein